MRRPPFALGAAVLVLAACSSDNNGLPDGAPATEDAIEEPAVDAPVDTPRDVRDASDVATDAPRDAALDAPADVARDAAADVALDTPSDAPRDVATDAPSDAPRDVAFDTPSDAPRDAAPDAAPDVPPDNGCGALSLCAGACVNTQTDARHCGACATACSAPANATPTCAAGRCGFACAAGFHLCAGACVGSTSVMSCGASCSPCEARANAAATCDGTSCRYACNPGFADCDGDAANGCERAVSSDVANCGRCGAVCPGVDSECRRRVCTGGVCGSVDAPSGTVLMAQTPRDCRRATCDGMGGVAQLTDDRDLPVDGNACTDDVCAAGVASNPPTPVGRGCGTGAMLCDGAGACVECVRGSDCATGVCMGGRCQMAGCSDGVRNGTETGVDCGGTCPVCRALVVLAGGTSGVLAGAFDTTARAWTTTALAGRTVEGVALAVTPSGEAVGLMRYTALGDPMDNRLRYTVWRAGAWAPFADLGPTVTTQGPASLVASPGGVYAAFHGFDYNHYFAAWSGTAWSPVAEPVGASGARAGALARDGDNALLVFSRGLANELYARTRAGSVWGGDQRVEGAAGFDYNVTPAAVNLTATAALAVWSAPGGQLRASLRASGAWSAPANVPMCLSTARPSLARVSDTQAALAFRGTDGNLYAALWSSGAWAAPVRVAAGITGAPAVARGVAGASAELAFLDGTGRVMHSRLASGAWSEPAAVGGAGFLSVALASGP